MATYDFKEKIILVTGAGAGIGKEICHKLITCGAQVIALSLLQDELDSLQKELPNIRTVQADLRDWKKSREIVSSLGPIDGLVNNAGISINKYFMKITEEQIDLTYSVNVKAAINMSQIVAKSLIDRKKSGAIVNISSIAALTSLPTMGIYCGSKGALQATSKVMALELGPKGIRVNTVNPTIVKTELSRLLWDNDVLSQALIARTPLGRYASAGDVANAVSFLLSEDASMINGTSIVVDGGYMA